jgi:hypothetical protein
MTIKAIQQKRLEKKKKKKRELNELFIEWYRQRYFFVVVSNLCSSGYVE